MNELWYMEQANMFSKLCPHKFKAYKKAHDFDNYSRKDYIYLEEAAARKVFMIVSGRVKIGYYNGEGEEIIKAILTKGELFGEKAILGVQTRNEFAQAISNNTNICAVGVDTLHNLMQDNKTFSQGIYKFLGWRFRKLERRLELLLFKDTKTRLLEFLEELKEEYGFVCPERKCLVVKHPYTQKDLACLIATSRPTLNLLMNELQQEKVLDFSRNEIVFL